MIMKLENIKKIDELSNFLEGAQPIAFAISSSKKERYHEIMLGATFRRSIAALWMT